MPLDQGLGGERAIAGDHPLRRASGVAQDPHASHKQHQDQGDDRPVQQIPLERRARPVLGAAAHGVEPIADLGERADRGV